MRMGEPGPRDFGILDAARKGHHNKMRSLILAGSNIEEKHFDNRTPLYLAVEGDHIECARVLLELGAKVNAARDSGWTALHWATWKGNLEMVRLLLRYYANPNSKTIHGEVPLHLAMRYPNSEIVKALALAGANLNAAHNGGITPLQLAKNDKNIPMITELISLGADPKQYSSSPYATAMKGQHFGLAWEILKKLGNKTKTDSFVESMRQRIFDNPYLITKFIDPPKELISIALISSDGKIPINA